MIARNEERARQRQEQYDKRHAQRAQRFVEKMTKKSDRDKADLNKRLAKLAEVCTRTKGYQFAFSSL